MRKILGAAALLAAMTVGFYPAQAATVTGTYGGEITDLGSTAVPGLALGDTYTFDYSYDLPKADSDSDPTRGSYPGLKATVTFSNGFTFQIDGSLVEVQNKPGVDQLIFHSAGFFVGSPSLGIWTLDYGLWTLTDSTGTAFSSDALPTSSPLASLFNAGKMTLVFVRTDVVRVARVNGTFGAVATTPIPATLPLLVSALGGLGVVGWRHRKLAAA